MQQQNHQLFPASMPGSAWYRRQPYLRNAPELRPTPGISPAGSREPSPQYEDAIDDQDLILPASIPLPPGTDSPLKGRSVSPEPEMRDYRRDQQQQQQQQRWDADNNKEDESTLTNCNFPLLSLQSYCMVADDLSKMYGSPFAQKFSIENRLLPFSNMYPRKST
jgi:hypothetical protein